MHKNISSTNLAILKKYFSLDKYESCNCTICLVSRWHSYMENLLSKAEDKEDLKLTSIQLLSSYWDYVEDSETFKSMTEYKNSLRKGL